MTYAAGAEPRLGKAATDDAASTGNGGARTLELRELMRELTPQEVAVLCWRAEWEQTARDKQRAPAGDWRTWGICTGRGFGKTLAGSNWLGLLAAQSPGSYNAVIAPTYQDVRYTCFEGPTGLLSVIPESLYRKEDYQKSTPSLTLWNGAVIRGFAGDSPDRLRGPQYHRVWAEEIAAWQYPEEAWSNMILGLRLGDHPQVMWTSTPRPTVFMRARLADKDSIITKGSTFENRDNLPDSFFAEVAQYQGTQLGRQELEGELLDPEEAGVVRRSQWKVWPADKPLPQFLAIIMSLDTAFTEETVDTKSRDPDYTACSVWGVFEDGAVPSMFEANLEGRKPTPLARRQVMLLDAWQDRLGFTGLVARVKKEMKYTYGDHDKPLIKPMFGSSMMSSGLRGKAIDMLVIEDKGSGISLRQALASEGIMTHAYNPGRADKLARLHLVSPLFANGRVWVVESDKKNGQPKSWAEPLIAQVCSYAGKGSLSHDDLLDSSTAGLRVIKDHFMPSFSFLQTVPDDALRLHQQRRVASNPYAV